MKRMGVLVIIAAIAMTMILKGMSGAENDKTQVVVAAAKTQNVYNSVSCSGTVEPIATYSISVPYTGVAGFVGVSVGDKVAENDFLFSAGSITDKTHLDYGIEEYLSTILSDKSIINEYIKTGKLPDNLLNAGTISAFASDAVSKDDLTDYYSPSSGIVTAVNIRENGLVLPGIACVTVQDVSLLQVTASVPEEYSYLLKVGQKANITVAGANTKVKGTIKKIMPYARQTGTILSTGETVVDVVISIDEYGMNIKPGLSATAKIITETRKNAITVPYEAIVQDNAGNMYMYVAKNGKAVKTSVLTGIELDNSVEILSGLKKPEYVIMNPDKSLADGTEIKCTLQEDNK